MSMLSEALNGLAKTDFSLPTGLGAGINNAYKSVVPTDVRNFIYDPQRDSPIGNINYTTGLSAKAFSGQDPFSGAGDTQYNQDVAKRAALVGAIFGGAALAGGAGAGGGTAGAAGAGSAAPVAASSAAGAPVAAAPWAPATAGGPLAAETFAPAAAGGPIASGTATPGTTAAMYETLGTAAPFTASPGTTGAMAAGSAVPGGSYATNVAAAAAPASKLSQWAPYAAAGGSILSTLFSGLLQMEKEKEANIQKLQLAQAEAHIKRAEAKNQGLNRLMEVWGRGTR